MKNRNTPQKILLALDGSSEALETVEYVSKMAPLRKMEVVLFRVFSKIPESYWDMGKGTQMGWRTKGIKAWASQQKIDTREFMQKAQQILSYAGFHEDAITIDIHERQRSIARDIAEEAKRGYSAVGVGRTGAGKLKDLVLGSTATKLIEKLAFVPLFVVGKNPKPGKVLLALDGSDGAMRAVDYVATTLGGSDLEVKLTNVVRGEGEEYLEEVKREMIAVFEEGKSRLMKSGFEKHHVTTKIITGAYSRAEAIVQEANEGGYGTIVVGRRGLSRVKEFFMGRVSNKVIQLAKEHAVWVVS